MKKNKIYIIGLVWLVVDQIIKFLITTKMSLLDKISVISGFFRIYYVKNDGAAFSMFSGMKYILIIVSIIILIYMINYIRKNDIKTKLEIISIGMLLGGLIGNLIDRIFYGNVIDYLSFKLFGYQSF